MEIDYVSEYLTGERKLFIGRFTKNQFLQAYYLKRFGKLLPYEESFKTGVTREDVVFGYRMFMGRYPESDAVIRNKLASCGDITDLRKTFILSEEFDKVYGSMKGSIKP